MPYFSSEKAGDQIDVTWWSGTESRNAGYVLYGGKSKNALVALTDLIVGAGDSFEPLEYATSVTTDHKQVWLADVDLAGKETLHGPYQVGKTIGSVPAPIEVDWSTSQAEAGAAARAAHDVRSDEQSRLTAAAAAEDSNPLSVRRVKVSSEVGNGNSAAVSVETAGCTGSASTTCWPSAWIGPASR